MSEETVTKPAGLAVCIAIGAVIVTIVGVTLPWLTAGLGDEAVTYSGLQLPPVALPVSIAALTTAVLAVGSVWRSPTLAPYAVLASGIGALIAAATIMVTETAALLIPTPLLPEAIQSATPVLGADAGIWLALTGSLIAAVAMHGRIPNSIVRRARLSRDEQKRMLALFGLATLTVLIAWLRYKTWIDATLLEQHLDLPAWAAPWIGPLTLIAVWLQAGALVLAGVYSARMAGLLAALAGWLTSVLAALVVLAVSAIGKLGLEDLAPPSVDGYVTGFHTTEFVWIAFAAGLTVAGIGAFLVNFPDRPGGEGAAWRS
jgi:hypothetical protein